MIANFYALLGAALIPIMVGFLWYGPMMFQNAWMKASGKTEEDLNSGSLPLILILTYILGFLLAFAISGISIHQSGVLQLFAASPDFGTEGTEVMNAYNGFMSKWGHMHRSFGHGALHGGIGAIIFALPLIGINAMFERRGAKYIFIHFGYWFVTMILMAGVICHF